MLPLLDNSWERNILISSEAIRRSLGISPELHSSNIILGTEVETTQGRERIG